MSVKLLFRGWCLWLVATLIVVAASIRWLDLPIALLFFRNSPHVAGLAKAFGTSVMIGGDVSLMVLLALIRIVRGSLPRYGEALFIACCASLSAFTANDYVLKLVFGRYGPYTFLSDPAQPVFNFFHGNQDCVFPSGHMVMSTAFAAVLIWLYPKTWPLFAVLLGIGAILLLIGDWHFFSDIIAGLFVGGTAGFLAGELWRQHVQRIRAVAG